MNKQKEIGIYKIGQKVAIHGYIDAINIENRNDIENTTTLRISTLVKTFSVNPKYEGVTIDLNKPKPVVPQYVADWYEENKDYFENKLFVYIRNFNIYNSWNESKNFNLWFDDNEDSIQTLVNMHQFGYEVEKEKLYTVEIPSHGTPNHIVLRKHLDGEICIDCYLSDEWRDYKCAQLTEAEIKEDFEWAWRFAKEVEE